MADIITQKTQDGRYIEAVGRRKTSIARVRITENKGTKNDLTVNNKPATNYFKIKKTQITAEEALSKIKGAHKFNVSVFVKGGGVISQAEAVRHGLARALVSFNGEWRDKLKKAGVLKRAPQGNERRNFGLKKARKRGQWSKR